MQYFETLIPKIVEDENTYFDMFFHFDITNDIDQEFLISYKVKDGETLQDIALEIYDDPQLWWLIAITNKLENSFFDIARSDNYVQKISIDFASINPIFWDEPDGELFWDSDGVLFWYKQEDYLTEYEAETIKNDARRDIIIIKPEYLSDVISLILERVNV